MIRNLYITILLMLIGVSNIYGQKLVVESKTLPNMISKKVVGGKHTACVIIQSALELSFTTNMGEIPQDDFSSTAENGIFVNKIYFYPTVYDSARTLIISCNGYVPERIALSLEVKKQYIYGVYDASSISGSQMSSSSSSVDKKTPSDSLVESALSFSEKISATLRLRNSTDSSSNSDILETYSNSLVGTTKNSPEKIFGEAEYKAMGSPANLVIPYGYTAVSKIDNSSNIVNTGHEIKIYTRRRHGGYMMYDPIDQSRSVTSNLKHVVIPNSVQIIDKEAFANCAKLESVIIPNSVVSIGSSSFKNCLNLTSVIIPNSVTSIGGSAFFNCIKLAEVEIPKSVTSIELFAFAFCNTLTSVNIPNTVKKIGHHAFIRVKKGPKLTISIEENGDQSVSDYLKWYAGETKLYSIKKTKSVL